MAGRGASGAASGRGPSQFSFYVSCDVNLQVRIKISELQGLLPSARTGLATLPPATGSWQGLPTGSPLELAASQAAAIAAAATASGPAAATARGVEPRQDGALGEGRMAPANSALYVSARITSCGDTLGLEAHSGYAQAYVYVPAAGDSGARSGGAAAGQEHGSGAGGVGGAGGMQDSNAGLVMGPDTQGLGAPGGGGSGCSGSGPDSTAQWHEWLTFCVKYRDLPPDALLVLCVHEAAPGRPGEALLGSTCMRLFSKRGRLKTGPQRLRLWEGVPPCTAYPSRTPGKVPLCQRPRLALLEHRLQRHQRGEAPAVDWLDALTLAEYRRLSAADRAAWRTRPELRLTVVLPLFRHPVLYHQHVSYTAAAVAGGPGMAAGGGGGKKDVAGPLPSPDPGGAAGGGLIRLLDPEVGRDNPAELKAQKLARGLQRGVLDRDLKPNSEERRKLQAILKLPPNKPLHADDRALLWRFRASLTSDTRALTKFLKCVDWGDALEAKQAAELMQQWAPISAADALELLSPDFRAEVVREHAVVALEAHDPDELGQYLLQLVQALRYEAADGSRLGAFLVGRAVQDPAFAIQLHWYLFCELDDPGFGTRARALHTALLDALARQGQGQGRQGTTQGQQGPNQGLLVLDTIRRQVDLVKQLKAVIRELKSSKIKAARATERLREMVAESGPCGELTTTRLPSPLDSSLMLAGIAPKECGVFKSAMLPLRLSFKLENLPVNWKAASLEPATAHSHHAGAGGSGTASGLGGGGGSSSGHHHHGHHHMLGSHSHAHHSHHGAPPDPLVFLPTRTGIVTAPGPGGGSVAPPPPPPSPAAAAAMLAQQQQQHGAGGGSGGPAPVVLEGYRCWMIYKKGDDLRQDHFILQMISLMDRMLKRENLDLRMTPYKVLPTSCDDGLLEFVPSVPLSVVLAEHRTIHRFLALTQADPSGPFGLRAECVETFVRSCAGYCVMTYILGVGDRHLDNLMLQHDGRLFHIDFGYILGNDPKPFPPPMKLCKEMIEAMGGQGSDYYKQFRMYACEAYNILRKRADLILSLFHLMAGASIEAIRADPEKAILKLQDKFRLDFDDEAAVEWMQGLINESATALLPQIVETTHRWAQYWR